MQDMDISFGVGLSWVHPRDVAAAVAPRPAGIRQLPRGATRLRRPGGGLHGEVPIHQSITYMYIVIFDIERTRKFVNSFDEKEGGA